MREIRTYGSEGGETQTNASFLPLSFNVGYIIPMRGAKNVMLNQMIRIPAIFIPNPNFIIWGRRIIPDP